MPDKLSKGKIIAKLPGCEDLFIVNAFAPNTNNNYPQGGTSFSKDSFAVNGSLVFQIKFCGESPALRVAAER